MDVSIDLKLERVCWQCEGTGAPTNKYPILDDKDRCNPCKGTGFELTDLGEALTKFLQRRGVLS